MSKAKGVEMTRTKWLFLKGFFFICLSGAFLCYGLLCFSQSPTRIEEKIEIGADTDTSESILLDNPCCERCSPSPCETAGSSITLPYESEVSASVISSEAGAPIAFGLESPYHEHYWDDATQHVGEDTLVGYFTQGTQLLFHIHPGGPCSSNVMYPKVSGSAPVWTLEFEDYWDCDWNDLVVEVRLCDFSSDSIKINLDVEGGADPRVDLLGSLNLVVAVTDSNCNPIDSFRIEFDATAIDSSGGHWHDGGRPTGYSNPDTGLTDQNGRLATTYAAPACTCGAAQGCNEDSLFRGIAGKYIVWAISRDDTTLWDSLHIDCGLWGLEELEAGDHWFLGGWRAEHPSNHYGTAASNQDLREIGTEFDSTMLARQIDAAIVRYNDQSLIWGGLFDIEADWLLPALRPLLWLEL